MSGNQMNAEEIYRFRRESINVSGGNGNAETSIYLIGESEPMRKLMETVALAAGCKAGVLLCGETGTGKREIARVIHNLRGREPLIPVCSGSSSNIIEPQLFGYIDGAYTGPISRNGYFSAGKGGTILFEEIEKMPAVTQARLMQVLRQGTFRKVGSTRYLRFDMHVIAMTEKDFPDEAWAGRFRADLYCLLSEITLHIPPLRERSRMDMDLLVQHLLAKPCFDRELAEPARITCGAMESLCRYDWLANVYELEQVLYKATSNTGIAGVITKPLVDDVIANRPANQIRERFNRSFPSL